MQSKTHKINWFFMFNGLLLLTFCNYNLANGQNIDALYYYYYSDTSRISFDEYKSIRDEVTIRFYQNTTLRCIDSGYSSNYFTTDYYSNRSAELVLNWFEKRIFSGWRYNIIITDFDTILPINYDELYIVEFKINEMSHNTESTVFHSDGGNEPYSYNRKILLIKYLNRFYFVSGDIVLSDFRHLIKADDPSQEATLDNIMNNLINIFPYRTCN